MAKHLQQEKIDLIRAALEADPNTDIPQLAERLQIAVRTVYDRIREMGFARPRGQAKRASGGRKAQEIAARIVAGVPIVQIASDLNCSVGYVQEVRRSMDSAIHSSETEINAEHRK